MARQVQTAEFNNFVKGLITEVSPLTFPANASLDETNFVLNRDGSRYRRLGLDYEDSHVEVEYAGTSSLVSTYRWKQAGGAAGQDLVVVQLGEQLHFFETQDTALSSQLIHTEDLSALTLDYKGEAISETISGLGYLKSCSYAKLGDKLIVSSGSPEVLFFTYDETSSTITKGSYRLRVRDLFGVDDFDTDGTDMTDASGLARRPSVATDNHLYNLRNQSWNRRYIPSDGTVKQDSLLTWKNKYSEYPSNGDVTTRVVYADTSNATNRTVDRFWAGNLFETDYGLSSPPRGGFLVDFLERGDSRLYEYDSLLTERSLSYPITDLIRDKTEGGASTVAAYSGRIFYSGFKAPNPATSDDRTPPTESFVLFSRIVDSPVDLGRCHQLADPTANTGADLIETDGGFLQISDANSIHTLVAVNQSLIVLSTNGAWEIRGGSGYGFAADNYLVNKISDKGALSKSSVVVVEGTLLYFGEEGIIQISQDGNGSFGAVDLTKQTIKKLYDSYPVTDRTNADGAYDPYQGKVRWVVGDGELVLDTISGAFSKSTFGVLEERSPSVLAIIDTPPYSVTSTEEPVVVGGEFVEAASEPVVIESSVRDTGQTSIAYLVTRDGALVDDPSLFTFAKYNNQSFKDWTRADGVGVDAKAYLLTGYLTTGDFIRQKQVPHVQFFLNKTETGFTEEYEPINSSSCVVSAQWDWTNNAVAGKWSNPFQAYRHKRMYFPANTSDAFEDGNVVVSTRNRLRGRGKTLSIRIETEEDKDLQLLGWGMILNTDGNI